MAEVTNQLNAKKIVSLGEGRWSDGGNLYLVVSPSGARRWAFIYRAPNGKQREMGLGSAGHYGVPLAKAREFAAEARSHLHQGRDPLDLRNKAKAVATIPTFGDFADAYISDHEAGWRNGGFRTTEGSKQTFACATRRCSSR